MRAGLTREEAMRGSFREISPSTRPTRRVDQISVLPTHAATGLPRRLGAPSPEG